MGATLVWVISRGRAVTLAFEETSKEISETDTLLCSKEALMVSR